MDIVHFDAGHYAPLFMMTDFSRAVEKGLAVRIATGVSTLPTSDVPVPWLKYKIGEGMWSSPIYSQPE